VNSVTLRKKSKRWRARKRKRQRRLLSNSSECSTQADRQAPILEELEMRRGRVIRQLRPTRDEVEERADLRRAQKLKDGALEMFEGCIERHRDYMERDQGDDALQECYAAGEWFDRLTGRSSIG
jgi:hypothetical protein